MDREKSQIVLFRLTKSQKELFFKKTGGSRGDASYVLKKLVKAYNKDEIKFT